jgi:hypothetical protein
MGHYSQISPNSAQKSRKYPEELGKAPKGQIWPIMGHIGLFWLSLRKSKISEKWILTEVR